MKFFRKSILLAGCAVLGACGGGGGSGGGVVSTPPPAPDPAPAPTPTPTPAPTPAPAPTPTPVSYVLQTPPPPVVISQASSGTLAEALEAPQGFVSGSLELDFDHTDGWLTSINRPYGSPNSLKFYVDPDAQTYTVYDSLAGGFPFEEADRNIDSGYKHWSRTFTEVGRALRFLPPGQTNEKFPDFELTYVSYGIWYAYSVGRIEPITFFSDQHDFATFFYFGVPTSPSSLPISGTANYQGIAEGRLFDLTASYDLSGTATLSANFATGAIETSLFLDALNLSNGEESSLGSFDGLARITSGENAFRGTWVASSDGYEGSILGSFFGPTASEFGYTFGINTPDLSAIGGGVVVGGQNTSPSPVPPPPPPPPPPVAPPPPAPPGSTFPLASERTFETISASMSYAGSIGAGGVTAGAISTAPASDQRTITVTPDYANGTYTVRDGGAASSFSLPELFPVPNPDNRYVSMSDGGDDRLVLFNNLAAGTGTNYPYLQLHHLSFAFHYVNDSATDQHRTTALLFGMPTPSADLPRSGSATYATQGFASALYGYGLFADVGGELTADFGSGTIENTFTISDYNGASVRPFYRMAGSGTITSGTPFFSGSLAGVGNPLTGSYTGGFFGPAADEVGFTFALTGQDAGGAEQRIVGAAGGKR